MKKIYSIIKKFIPSDSQVLLRLLDLIVTIVTCVKNIQQNRGKKKMEQEKKEIESKIDDVCDNGSIQDLIDISDKIKTFSVKCLFFTLAVFIAGCNTINIYVTKPYEGRYDDKQTLLNAIQSAEISKKQQVWVLSADTLKKILKNTGK